MVPWGSREYAGWTEPSRGSAPQHVDPRKGLSSQDWQGGASRGHVALSMLEFVKGAGSGHELCISYMGAASSTEKVNSSSGNTAIGEGQLVPVTLWRKGQRPRKGEVLLCNTVQPQTQVLGWFPDSGLFPFSPITLDKSFLGPRRRHSRCSMWDVSMEQPGCSQQCSCFAWQLL